MYNYFIQGVRAASHVNLVVAELCRGTPVARRALGARWKNPTPELNEKVAGRSEFRN